MRIAKLEEKIVIPEGVDIEIVNGLIKVKGPKGENQKRLVSSKVKISKKDKTIVLLAEKPSKREKTTANTFKAHIKNLIKGVTEPFVYTLKICSGHFPMHVSVEGNYVIIKNFFGEKVPRKARILPNVEVKVQGDTIIVEGNNKENVSQTSASIEVATRVVNRDRRVFGDGIFITNKAGKVIK